MRQEAGGTVGRAESERQTAKRLLKFNAGGRQSRWPVAETCVFEEFQSAIGPQLH